MGDEVESADQRSETRASDRPRRLTIEHVAAEAGVSVATVSRALRGLPNVTPSTRERVQAVADRMQYHPDPAATRLAAGRTGTVTLAIPSLFGWYFSTVVAGAEAVCADAGLEFQVIAVSTPGHRDRLLDESRRLERRTDALILVDVTIEPAQVVSLERRGVGLATIGSNVVGHPSVCIDDELVGEIAARHLLDLGHRHIGVIAGRPEGPMSFDVPQARWRGFQRVVSEADIALDDESLVNGNFSLEGGYEAMVQLLDRTVRPTAVFAMSDEMAFGALMACRERSLNPGTDISVIGVDDHEFSRVLDLTTVHQPVADLGSVVARLLVAAMRQSTQQPDHEAAAPADLHDEPVCPNVSLVNRSSTGSAPCT